jgi:putative ABC transport system permease protein
MPGGVPKGATALRETFWIAVDALRAHKLRSFLTLLGVILAVTTLVAVISVLDGLNRYVSDRVANLGANAFVVDRLGIITNFEDWVKAQRRPPLRLEDYEDLRDRLQLVSRAAALKEMQGEVRYGSETLQDIDVDGVTANFDDVRIIEVAAGRSLNETDDEHHSPVCFIGADVANRFFPNVDPIGKSVRVGPAVYQVIGVAKALGSVFGQTRDNFVQIPLSTYQKTFEKPDDSVILFLQAQNAELMEAAADEVRVLLRARRHVPYDAPDNFGIILPSSITGLWQRLTGNIYALAISFTSIFLVIGGIVIMNIMLASVVERTREIGIRKSIGARRRQIVIQFLVESSVLASVGGVMGVLGALALGELVRLTTPIPISTPLRAIVTALLLSTTVGLFFGIYPAVRAARLDPIEALRAET